MKYVFMFSFFVNLLMLTVPIFMLLVFDYVLTSFSQETLLFLALIAVFALAVMSFLDIIRGVIMRRVAFWFESQLDDQALKILPDQILKDGEYGTQSLSDLASIRMFLTSPSIFSLFDVPWMPIYLAVIFILNPYLGWFALLGALILIGLGYLNEFISKDSYSKAHQESLKNQQTITLVMRNAEAIQAMGMMDNVTTRWKEKNKPVTVLLQHSNDVTGIISSISKFARLFLQLGILAIGAYLVINENLTPGGMIAASILLSRALSPAEQSIVVWKQLTQVREAFHKLKQVLSMKSERGTGINLPKPKGSLVVKNVTYQPENVTHPILNKLSFTLAKGQIMALVGASGAGKTSLARLISGIIKPTEGNITLDDVDVYKWEREDFGKHIGYVPQDIELVPGTIKDNIARMSPEPNDEEVLKAAKLAGVHSIILNLPDAYDTEIGYATNRLSGGQRQLIALARAFYNSPELLILDEPTSNLDIQGEKNLFKALKFIKENGSTIIINTHHIPTLQIVDTIALLAKGSIVTMGSREEILRKTNAATKDG